MIRSNSKHRGTRKIRKTMKHKKYRKTMKHKKHRKTMKKRSMKKKIIKSKKKYKGGLTKVQEEESNIKFLKSKWVKKEYWDEVIRTGHYQFATPNTDITLDEIIDADRNKWTPPKNEWGGLDYSLTRQHEWPGWKTVEYRSGPHMNPVQYHNKADGTLYNIDERFYAYGRFVTNSPCNKGRCKCSIKDCNNYYWVPEVSINEIDSIGPRSHPDASESKREQLTDEADAGINKLYENQGWWEYRRGRLDNKLTTNGYVGWLPVEDADGIGRTYYLCPVCYIKRLKKEEELSKYAILQKESRGEGPHVWPIQTSIERQRGVISDTSHTATPDSSIQPTPILPSAPPAHEVEAVVPSAPPAVPSPPAHGAEPVVVAQEIPHLSFREHDSVHFKHDGSWYDGIVTSSDDKGVNIYSDVLKTIFIPNNVLLCSIIKNC